MLRATILLLTILTGFTGLAYEITWQKYFATLLGAHSEATAAVLAIFLGGLSVGYALFGGVARRLAGDRRILLVYGAVEAAIGAYCLLFPALFRLARGVSGWLPGDGGLFAFSLDVGLAALLIGPPTVLMGATIPLLTQALTGGLDEATRVHARIYAANTAGATAGALAAGFALIPALGLDGVMRAMGVVNIVAGAVVAALAAVQRRGGASSVPEGAAQRQPIPRVYSVAALLVGFAMMVLQTILIRVGGLAFGSSEYTFSIVVAVFVLCIALGSLWVSALERVGRALLPATLWALALLFAVLYTQLDTAPHWAHVLRSMIRDHPQAFLFYQGAAFLAILLVIGPAVVLSGASLPLLFHAVRREVADLGANAGRLYATNTIGSLLGALLGGYALLFWLDLHHVYRIATVTVACAAALVTGRLWPRVGLAGSGALALVSIVAIAWLSPWQPDQLASGLFRLRQPTLWSYQSPDFRLIDKVLFHDDDPISTVTVVESPSSPGTRSIVVNGKSDGNSFHDRHTMAMAGLVPALFAERAERSFVIGYGTGVTVGALVGLEETRSVTVAEISPAVIAAAPHFEFANRRAAADPKVRIVRRDAYRALLDSDEHFDVIVSEPSNPWVAGVEMLFSVEFLEAARDRLTPGGVYAQWYHLYETDDASVALVLRTYATVFDEVVVWRTQSSDLLLIGLRDPETALDLDRLAERVERPDFRRELGRLGIDGLAPLLVHETLPLGVVHAAGLEGPVHTLTHPRLAYQAGRGFFRGERAALPFTGSGESARVGRENSLLRRHLERLGHPIPDEIRKAITRRACETRIIQCTVLIADWMGEDGEPAALRDVIDERTDEDRRMLPRLGVFLGDEETSTGKLTPAEASRATQIYIATYFHAIPYSPETLVDLWGRCEPAAQCAGGRLTARGIAADDDPDAAAGSDPPQTP